MDACGFSGLLLEILHRNLHQSDVVLDGTDFIPWKLIIKRILDSICVFRHIDGICTASTVPVVSNTIIDPLKAFAFLTVFE